MTALTVASALSLAAACAPSVDPNLLVGIARYKSGLNSEAIHKNANGSIDYGLMQINDLNFSWLGLTIKSSLDPCRSMAAAAAVLTGLSRYNTGLSARGIANGYAQHVIASVHAVKVGTNVPPEAAPCPEPDPTGWHAIARAAGCQPTPDAWHITSKDVP